MIFGVGNDIVNIARFEKDGEFLERFIRRMSDEGEYRPAGWQSRDLKQQAAFVAKRFAAKEAVVKAMGSGFRGGIYLKHIQIRRDKAGKPFVVLTEGAWRYMREKTGGRSYQIHLSLSDDYPYAAAVAVIETTG